MKEESPLALEDGAKAPLPRDAGVSVSLRGFDCSRTASPNKEEPMLRILRDFSRVCRTRLGGYIGAMVFFIALASLTTATNVSAQTLEAVKSAGKLRVGVQAANMPWGFADASGATVGYDIDVATLLAKEIGVELELVPVTGQSRIAQLITGKVDILFAVLGMFPDRAEVLQFTKPYAGLSYWVIGPKDKTIKDFPDLSGMKISASKASAEEKVITEKAPSDATIRAGSGNLHSGDKWSFCLTSA
jgi:ABC-type amino acid transport substrate-binding protein